MGTFLIYEITQLFLVMSTKNIYLVFYFVYSFIKTEHKIKLFPNWASFAEIKLKYFRVPGMSDELIPTAHASSSLSVT